MNIYSLELGCLQLMTIILIIDAFPSLACSQLNPSLLLVSVGLVVRDRASLWHITPVLAVSTHDSTLLLVVGQILVNGPLLQRGLTALSTSPSWVLAQSFIDLLLSGSFDILNVARFNYLVSEKIEQAIWVSYEDNSCK